MMKKWIAILLASVLVFSLWGCNSNQIQDPGNFYYRRIDAQYLGSEGIISPEIRELSDMGGDFGKILADYFLGPASPELESPFPRDTKLVQWTRDNNTLSIQLNEAFTQLSGIELSVACGCIARTCFEMTDASAVHLTC